MSFAENHARITAEIIRIAKDWRRDPDAIRLMAVSKMQGQDALENAIAHGQSLFGENRVQEAVAHWQDSGLKAAHPDLKLHLIGPLQTNKVKQAVALFDCIETLDRPALAEALSAEMRKTGRNIPCLIQVNTGAEPQKAGIAIADLPEFYRQCTQDYGLTVTGLMCIPPADQLAAPHFALMQDLAARLGVQELSMGMSGDYTQAIPLGATIIRIGTALFGQRVAA
jgi:pyridoxal phosphate enzyme (YggS family)